MYLLKGFYTRVVNLQCVLLLDFDTVYVASRDRIAVSTLRCGRSSPGSNPGHGIFSNNLIQYAMA